MLRDCELTRKMCTDPHTVLWALDFQGLKFQVKRVRMVGFFSSPVQLLRYRCSVVGIVGYKQDLSFQFRGIREFRVYAKKMMPMLDKKESEGLLDKG